MRTKEETAALVKSIIHAGTPIVTFRLDPPEGIRFSEWAPEVSDWAVRALLCAERSTESEVIRLRDLLSQQVWSADEVHEVAWVFGTWAVEAVESSPGLFHAADSDGLVMALEALVWYLGGE